MQHGAGTWALGYQGLEAALWHYAFFLPAIVTMLYGADVPETAPPACEVSQKYHVINAPSERPSPTN